ncbi:MAG: hypothetical protein MUC59_14470, partial [Saprospiraceae bacterium]|nr:hypothetical protein [Saprospiraceae bacterium]
MPEYKLCKSPWKAIKLIVMSLPFVAMGIWVHFDDDNPKSEEFWGWFGIVFFGLGIILGFFHLFDRRPQIVVKENGIWDRTTNQNEIKWSQNTLKSAFGISSS